MKKTWINSPDEPEGMGESLGFTTDKRGSVAEPQIPEHDGPAVTSQLLKDRKALQQLMPDETILL